MSSNYTGNPTSGQSPGLAPMPGGAPVVSDPSDGDPLAAASVIQQQKAAADYLAYLNLPGRRIIYQENYLEMPTVPAFTAAQNPFPQNKRLNLYLNGASSQAQFWDVGKVTLPAIYCGMTCELVAGPTTGRYAFLITEQTTTNQVGSMWIPTATAAAVLFETDISVVNITNGVYFIGMQQTGINAIAGNPGVDQFVGLRSVQGGTKWQLQTHSGLTDVPSSAFSNNTAQHLRMVIYGSATPRGVQQSGSGVDVWVNDTLQLQKVDTLTSSTSVFSPFQSSYAPDAGGGDAFFSPWTVTVNHY